MGRSSGCIRHKALTVTTIRSSFYGLKLIYMKKTVTIKAGNNISVSIGKITSVTTGQSAIIKIKNV